MADLNESARINSLESRTTALEIKTEYSISRLERMEGKIDLLVERLTRAEERIENLPKKGFIVSTAIIALTLLGGLFVLMNNLKGFTNAAPMSQAPSTTTKSNP